MTVEQFRAWLKRAYEHLFSNSWDEQDVVREQAAN
jgi:hypothetical protein